MAAIEPWHIKGELVLSCNCTVFCPCVISLGKHPPTEGYCKTWGGLRIDSGRYGDVMLSGLNLGLIMEIPGPMSLGDWTAGLFVDDNADVYQTKALTRIMTGRAEGSTRIMSILVSRFLGVHQEPIVYDKNGDTRRFVIPKIIDGEVRPVRGSKAGKPTVVENSRYWVGSRIIVAEAVKSRFRAFGRNWDFRSKSAEICAIDWKGP